MTDEKPDPDTCGHHKDRPYDKYCLKCLPKNAD